MLTWWRDLDDRQRLAIFDGVCAALVLALIAAALWP